MSMLLRGMFRIQGVGILSNEVRVTDGTLSFSVPEDIYRGQLFCPAFENLPWEKAHADENKADAL
jgi:hypothetical protein